jgi:hypothetical protein
MTKDVILASFSLASIHYVLERLFRTTMNPFVTLMYARVKNTAPSGFAIGGQLIGLGLACLFSYVNIPTKEKLAHIYLAKRV